MFKAMPPRWRDWVPASVAIVLALCIALFVWNQRQERLRNDLQADFSFESREVAVRLLERMRAHKQVLRGVRAAISTLGVPDREGWVRYVANQFLDVDFPGMQGVGYAARIATDDLAAHEARMKAGGYPDYVVSAKTHLAASIAPVVRLAPDEGPNRSMVGIDLLGQPDLGAVLESSAAQAATVLSAPVALRFPDRELDQNLVFMVQPIFAPLPSSAGTSGDKSAPRRNHRDGWVFAVFKAPELIQATLGALPPHMTLQVFSDRSLNRAALIFESPAMARRDSGTEQPLRVTTELELDGQTWTLVFEGFPRAYGRNLSFNWELFSILAICTLFGLSALLVTWTRSASRKLMTMTDELQDSNQRYQFLATHDALTQVANRLLFSSRLETTLAESVRYQRRFGIIYIDLDRFKPVNDQHGHEVGDALLKAVADRLSRLLRDSDLLARQGGDEFVVLLPCLDDVNACDAVAQKICNEMARPFEIGPLQVLIGASLGVAVYPLDGNEVEQLIIRADHRMYLAKQAGGNRWIAQGD